MGADESTRWDERFMRLALEEAQRAGQAGEVPVGSLVVLGDRVVGRGHNSPIRRCDPTAHAEIVALREAAAAVGNYRIPGATLFCSVEPCLMCLGAALHARVDRVVYGAADPKVGATAQFEALRREGAGFNHRFEIAGGVLGGEAAMLLRSFFERRRVRAGAASTR